METAKHFYLFLSLFSVGWWSWRWEVWVWRQWWWSPRGRSATPWTWGNLHASTLFISSRRRTRKWNKSRPRELTHRRGWSAPSTSGLPTNNSPLAHAPFPQFDLPPPPIELCQNAAERQDRDPPPPSEGATGAAVDSEQDGKFTCEHWY